MIAQIIAQHIRNLITDLDGYQIQNTVCQPLFSAGIMALSEVSTALDEYFVTTNADRLHRELVTSLMDFNQRWEDWLDSIKAGFHFQNRSSVTFHEFLLRVSKGAAKNARIWKIDSTK